MTPMDEDKGTAMPDLYAVCTPNSLPVAGSTPHGYQLIVLDADLHVNEVADLTGWQKFDRDAADLRLTSLGYAPKNAWATAGLGHMVAVTRVDELQG